MTQPVKTHPNIHMNYELYKSNIHQYVPIDFYGISISTYTAPLKSHIKTSKATTSTVYFPTLGIASTRTRRRGLGITYTSKFSGLLKQEYTPNTSGGTSLLVLLQDWCHFVSRHLCCDFQLSHGHDDPCLSNPRQDGTLWGPFLHFTSVFLDP